MKLLVLALAALVTSTISGIIGMGGGILLLAVMLSFDAHAVVIPAHGAVQLVSNSTRLLAFINHVDWSAIRRFLAGVVPGAILGGLVLSWVGHLLGGAEEPFLKAAIGAYVLIMTFKPVVKVSPDAGDDAAQSPPNFLWWGALTGALGLTIGAIGPLIAPLFLHSNYVKERLIATKAVCQASVHLMKIPVFLISGLASYQELGVLILVMCLMVIPGTLIGKSLLKHVSEALFVRLFRIAMLVAGLKVLVVDGLYRMIF